MLVVDASVIVKLVVDEPGTDIARQTVSARDDCIAPDLLMIEVASALAKKVRFTSLPMSVAIAGLESVPEFIAELASSGPLFVSAVRLSVDLNHSLFDCLYLALAVQRDCAVLTADVKFANAASAGGHGSNVALLR